SPRGPATGRLRVAAPVGGAAARVGLDVGISPGAGAGVGARARACVGPGRAVARPDPRRPTARRIVRTRGGPATVPAIGHASATAGVVRRATLGVAAIPRSTPASRAVRGGAVPVSAVGHATLGVAAVPRPT